MEQNEMKKSEIKAKKETQVDKSQGREGDKMSQSKKLTTLFTEKKIGQLAWLILLGILFLYLSSRAQAQLSTETIATGGVLVNYHDNLDNGIYNPARLSFGKFRLKLAGVGLSFDGNNSDVFKYIRDHNEDLTNWADLTPEERKNINSELIELENRQAMLSVSPVVGIAFKKFALAGYATSFVDLELLPIDTGTTPGDSNKVALSASQKTEAVILLGMSNTLFDRIALGVNFRFINRWENKDVEMGWNEAGDMENWLKVLWEDKDNLQTGYAGGAGVAVKLSRSTIIEYSADNLLYKLDDEEREIHSRIQATTEFGRNFITRIVSARALRVAAAITSDEEAMPKFDLKKAAAGVELEWPLIKLRGGINDGQYSYGANLNLALINIGYACQIADDRGRFHTVELAIEF
jgi:opacity protein-like surface antigen